MSQIAASSGRSGAAGGGRGWLRPAAAALAMAGLAAAAGAEPFAYTHRWPGLARIDLATLEIEPIGPARLPVSELTFDRDGDLFGFTSESPPRLLRFDLTTAAVTEIGEIDLGGRPYDLTALAGDACGRLWAGGAFRQGPGPGGLRPFIVAVDPATGAPGEPIDVAVPPSGPPECFVLAARGETLIAQSPSGVTAIDPAAGETSLLIATEPASMILLGLSLALDDGLWSVWAPLLPPVPYAAFSRLDLNTGEVSGPGLAVLNVTGLAIAPIPGSCSTGTPPAIPTLSPLALAALAAALALAALWIRRRSPHRRCGGPWLLVVLAGGLSAFVAATPAGAQVTALTVYDGSIYEADLAAGTFLPRTVVDPPIGTVDGITLSASGELLAFADNRLVAIDPESGAGTELAVFGFTEDQLIVGLAEDPCGRLFLRLIDLHLFEGRILRLDPATASGEVVARLRPEYTGGLAIRGNRAYVPGAHAGGSELAFSSFHLDNGSVLEHPVESFPGPVIGGYDFGLDGDLWVALQPIGLPLPPTPIYQIDLASGNVVFHPPRQLFRFAVAPPAGQCLSGTAAIPTASAAGLLALAAALALWGTVLVARRRQA